MHTPIIILNWFPPAVAGIIQDTYISFCFVNFVPHPAVAGILQGSHTIAASQHRNIAPAVAGILQGSHTILSQKI